MHAYIFVKTKKGFLFSLGQGVKGKAVSLIKIDSFSKVRKFRRILIFNSSLNLVMRFKFIPSICKGRKRLLMKFSPGGKFSYSFG